VLLLLGVLLLLWLGALFVLLLWLRVLLSGFGFLVLLPLCVGGSDGEKRNQNGCTGDSDCFHKCYLIRTGGRPAQGCCYRVQDRMHRDGLRTDGGLRTDFAPPVIPMQRPHIFPRRKCTYWLEVPASHRPASANKVDDEDYHGQNQQEVNEGSSDMQAEAE
jgi:hypothetical protein